MSKKQISNYKFVPGNVTPDTNLFPNTVGLVYANRKFILEETIAYIAYNSANNIAPFAYFTYDTAKCRRDISYVLEGYISDIRHGGNKQTVNNASKYFENGVPQVDGTRLPEVAAHTFIKNLIENYVLANVAFTGRQSIVTQTIDNSLVAEAGGFNKVTLLANIIISVITNGLSSLPAVDSNRGYVKFPGFYKLKDILLITNTTQNQILYNFADPDSSADLTYSEQFDSDFAGALYGNEKITTVTLEVDTSAMMVTDQIQIFVEGKEQAVRLNSIATDAMERMKVGIPQSMLDADFEYGLQPTKWQTISMMRNYPSVYEIPGSDVPVISVNTDASAGTSGVGSSLITVVTGANHGLVANDVFTIKALAASVKGFGRAEGTFQVASVLSATSFTYYAKSKVGTTNPTLLSSNYTQLRKAGYYTGASVGSPTFNVYSNGQSGTITTLLSTLSGSTVIGFTGTAPVIGAPLAGSGVNSGTQVTAVNGNGGTVTVASLTTTANIGDTGLIVSSTVGITPGLIVNRGDGYSLAVTDVTGNTISLSGSLTSKILGSSQTYSNLSQTSSSGTGVGATFDISRISLVYRASISSSNGNGYLANDTIIVAGTSLDGTSTTNDATITVLTASAINSVSTFTLPIANPGTGYVDATSVATSGSVTGTGLTVDITTDLSGFITNVVVNNAGANYVVGDIIIIAGGNGDANIEIASVNAGGDIQSFTISGTPITPPSINFISAFTISDATTSNISTGNTGLTYTSIATIEVNFTSAHGFVPGDSITVQISSSGANAQLAGGSYYVEQVPTSTSLRYTARTAGVIANTLTGIMYSRPDSYYVHRPYDGGVQLGTGGPSHGATAIRMSKKYIRYQSGKGVMYNTGALFAPSYDLSSISASSTSVGATITLATDDTDHGCQVGAQITVNGVTTSGYNGVYTISRIVDERTLQFQATQVLGATSAVMGSPCYMSVFHWHGATVRSGTFDDQNGMFWQYDGIRMALVKRSSTNNLTGTINLAANSNAITGVNTRFTQQLAAGDRIVIKGMSHVISSITSDTVMTVTPDYRGVTDVVGGKAMKTIDLIVPQENWNLDPLNGSGPSGYNIDVTKMQMIGMQWTWYGAGFIDFMLRGPDGNYVFAHRFRNSNVNQEAYMRSGNQPVRYEVINEGAKSKLASTINASATTIPLENAYYFPTAGTVMIDAEMIRFTGNDGTNLTGCVRSASLTQFVAGSSRTFTGGIAASHNARAGVILVSSTVTPIISHWGSAFMIDGQFDSDRGYIFNYAATGVTATVDKNTAFLIRLAPSVSNAQTGDLGERELLNRAQLLLAAISITSDSVTGGGGIVVEGVLNPSNYPTDPTKITWTGLSSSAAGGQPSFAQIAPGGSVTWSGNFSTTTATVQGAFNTTIVAKSFAPSTTNLTAQAFNAVTQTTAAVSFNNTQTATVPAVTLAQNTTYQFAFQNTRNDFLIPQSVYAAYVTPLAIGDSISVPTYVTSGQTIASITPSFITINAVLYARIVMSGNASTSSATNTAATATFTTAASQVYNTALSTGRNDFLITNTAYDTFTASTPLAVGDVLSATTYLTGGQTITSITRSYLTIAGVAYTRIVMSAPATVSSPAAASNGAQNITTTFASSIAAAYNSALNTNRATFLITQTQYASIISTVKITDVLSVATYITGGQTVAGLTANYTTISGVAYALVSMTSNANATSTAGSANSVTVVNTSAATATYGSALSTARSDFLVTDAAWTAAGALAGDGLSVATYITTTGQQINTVTPAYINIGGTSYTRILMSSPANATSTSGSGNDITVTITAAGTAATYVKTNYLFFDSTTWAASNATIGTRIATDQTKFPAGTSVNAVTTRTFGATTVYRVSFTQSSNATYTAATSDTLKFQYGAAYALPGEQVFSFISNPGGSDTLTLDALKELTSTSIGGRGTFPNGPDVLAINVYKTAGTSTTTNVILRWGEAQA